MAGFKQWVTVLWTKCISCQLLDGVKKGHAKKQQEISMNLMTGKTAQDLEI
jgi:hypothetical protein